MNMDMTTILIIAGAALVALGMLAGALWVALLRERELGKLVSVAKESRDNFYEKFWAARKDFHQAEERARNAEHDARELQRRNDEMITKGAGSTNAAILFDLAMRKFYAERERKDAETAALKDKLAKAQRELEDQKAFQAGMQAAADSLRDEVAELKAEALRFYHADGSFEELASREEVVARRKECAAYIAQMESALRQAQGGSSEPEPDAVVGVLEKFAGELDIAVVNPATGEARKLDA